GQVRVHADDRLTVAGEELVRRVRGVGGHDERALGLDVRRDQRLRVGPGARRRARPRSGAGGGGRVARAACGEQCGGGEDCAARDGAVPDELWHEEIRFLRSWRRGCCAAWFHLDIATGRTVFILLPETPPDRG